MARFHSHHAQIELDLTGPTHGVPSGGVQKLPVGMRQYWHIDPVSTRNLLTSVGASFDMLAWIMRMRSDEMDEIGSLLLLGI